jgi:hypothetical protein
VLPQRVGVVLENPEHYKGNQAPFIPMLRDISSAAALTKHICGLLPFY